MEIQPAVPSGKTPEPSASSTSALSSDFETFLRMLTVQMENQDPLNPVQSSDFAVQLATFAGVEQQIRTNQLLESLGANLTFGGVSQLAGWVGLEARAAAPAWFSDQPITLWPEVPPDADQATLVVRNAAGSVVSEEAVSAEPGEILWGGTDPQGRPLPEGLYSFFLEARREGELLSVEPVALYARIAEARLEDGQPVLVFEGGGTAPASAVTAVRSPG